MSHLQTTTNQKLKFIKMKEIKNKIAADIMVKDVITIKRKEILKVADEIFSQHQFHHILVVDNERNMCGILSKSDVDSVKHFSTSLGLKKAEIHNSRILGSLIAEDIMQEDVFTVDSKTPSSVILDCFLENEFHALPVVDNGKLLGIITQHDILKMMKNII